MRAAIFILLFVLTNSLLALLYPFSWSRFFLCAALYTIGTLEMLYLLFYPRSQFLVANRSQVDSDGKRCVALTFDDGPNSQHTEALLRILREKGVKATFFVVGKHALANPDRARLLVAEGHQVGNHTYSHPPCFCFLSPNRLRHELEQGQEAIIQTCRRTPRYFRSPVGLRHPLLRSYLLKAGLEFISWRVRGYDSRIQEPETLARRITDKIKPGDIILLHDKAGKATDRMLEVLPGIIDELKRRGFEFVPV
jgi:peptidoglycan/xylan/chitin deacetylase (PgdA/CDA1 family)